MPLNKVGQTVPLKLFAKGPIFKRRSFSPGTYHYQLDTEGNALLSILFVNSIDAGTTLDVRYFQFGEDGGDTNDVTERIDLADHQQFTPANSPGSQQIIVTSTHVSPWVEIEVAGGSVECSLLAFVSNTFASDIDAALLQDGDPVDLGNDKGLAIVCRDLSTGTWKFIPCDENGLLVSGVIGAAPGDPKQASAAKVATTPGTEQTLLDLTVPAGKTWYPSTLKVTCRQSARAYLEVGNTPDYYAAIATGPANKNAVFDWRPIPPIPENTAVKLKFTQLNGTASSIVDAFLMYSEDS